MNRTQDYDIYCDTYIIRAGEPQVKLAVLHSFPSKPDLDFLKHMVWNNKTIAYKKDCVERVNLDTEDFELWGDDTEDVTNDEEELLRFEWLERDKYTCHSFEHSQSDDNADAHNDESFVPALEKV